MGYYLVTEGEEPPALTQEPIMTTASTLIAQSTAHNQIVNAAYNARLLAELVDAADGWTDSNDGYEFWGAAWRVHLQGLAATDAALETYRDEAAAAGDTEMVDAIDRALEGDVAARAIVEEGLAYSALMDDGDFDDE